MTYNLNPETSLAPLTAGKVISSSLRIYRDHFKSFTFIALQASLWGFVPLLAFFVLPFVNFAVFKISTGLGVLAWVTSIVGWIYLLFYCAEKALRNSALIARLTFQLLKNQPETTQQARDQLPRRKLVFFLTQFLTSFLIFLAYCAPSSLRLFLFLVSQDNIFIALFTAVLSIISLGIYLWVFARLFIPEVSVATEKMGPINAIAQSWKLTEGFAWQIILIILVIYSFISIVYILPIIPIIIFGIGFVGTVMATSVGGVGIESITTAFMANVVLFCILLTVSLILSYTLSVFVIPIWQTIKGVIYFDLRSRREGFAIQSTSN